MTVPIFWLIGGALALALVSAAYGFWLGVWVAERADEDEDSEGDYR